MTPDCLTAALTFIQPWLSSRFERLDVPGMIVAIGHVGQVAYEGCFGYADTPSDELMTPNHAFRIASQSKTFTATAIMQLAELGILDIEERVGTYIPQLKVHTDSRWDDVTLKHLLSHGAGIVRDSTDANYWELTKAFPDQEQLLNDILQTDLVQDPGVSMKYSNAGYGLLGLVIERASGMTFSQYIQDSIITPLGLQGTGTDVTEATTVLVSHGHSKPTKDGERHVLPDFATNALQPATGFYATATDLCRYYAAISPGNNDTTLLTEASKDAMHKTEWHVKNSANVEYGLGIDIGHIGGRRITGHGGGYPGHKTNTFVDAQDQLVATAYINCIDGDALVITSGIINTLNHFRDNYKPASKGFQRFNKTFTGLWDSRQIVATGDSIVSIDPHSAQPFANCEQLAYVDDTTLQVTKASGFESEGELVRFEKIQDGKEVVIYCGRSMVLFGDDSAIK